MDSICKFNPIEFNGLLLPVKCLHYKFINGFYVPCGKCEFCREARAREWAFRLESESMDKFCYNCLLTYSDEYLPYYDGKPSLNKVHIQVFLKKFRYHVDKCFNTKIKFFLCGEYGGHNHRPHYHLLIFSDKKLTRGVGKYGLYTEIQEIFEHCWHYGIADIEPLNNVGGSVRYLVQYMLMYHDGKEYNEHNKPFLQMSRCGLGKNWIDEHPQLVDKMKSEYDYTFTKSTASGKKVKVSLPRYLRRKITDESEQIARADAYYNYCADFKEKLREIHTNKKLNQDYGKKLKQEREYQRIRELEQYRSAKIHANNANTSKLSNRVATAEKQQTPARTSL